MSRPRRLQWEIPESPPPKHPYRDTLIVYAGLAVIVVLIAWGTGGSLGRAIVIAALFFCAASAWTSWRWSQRLRAERKKAESADL
jgi:Flp pilus assembly protein TadB